MSEFDFLSGIFREPPRFRSDRVPTIAREALDSAFTASRPKFAFQSWAAANGFDYPAAALSFLCCCESAAEAFLAREVVRQPGAYIGEADTETRGTARFGCDDDLSVRLQVPLRSLRIDMVAELAQSRFKLAIEVDGLGFHQRSAEQIASDYLRERRLVALGYTVIRFTAQEVFVRPAECWRQVDAILSSRRTPR